MAFAKIYSAQSFLPKTHLVSVEIDLSRGLHAFSIVGLPDKGIEESKDRVSAAIKNSGFKSPKQINKKVVVSLAPADIKKEGPLFDLPIALAYLLAEEYVSFDSECKLFAGELALDGSIRPIRGALSCARMAKEQGMKEVYVPKENAIEAALIEGVSVFGVASLREVVEHLLGRELIRPTPHSKKLTLKNITDTVYPDFDTIAGQEFAKRALTIAAAGGHNVALFGPPGTGKTLLAKSIAGLLPDLNFEEVLEVTEIYSANGQGSFDISTRPPLRTPHHTSSYASIIGGTGLRPGEITLAHRGVLFMDEFPEFDSRVIEALRQPLEERIISVSRARGSVQFPANFVFVIAFNPCPCGNRNVQGKSCLCTARDIERYQRKLSGPIVDRIDMWVEVSKVEYDKLMRKGIISGQAERARNIVSKARIVQRERFMRLGKNITFNSEVGAGDMREAMSMESGSEDILKQAATVYGLSGRGYHRVIKLARTIADIDSSERIRPNHVLEALQYRQKNIT